MKVITGSVDCKPKDVGYDKSRLDAVNNFFAGMIERNVIHGVSYRLARHGKTFAAAAMGSRHYKKTGELMQPDSVFSIASVTKSFTAVAIQALVEDGLLAIEDKVAKYLPQFDGAPYDQITLFHLLTHTSGLYSEGSIPDKHHEDCFTHMERQYEKDGKNTDWIAAGLRGGMRCKPGVEWQYCSFGIIVLGAIIEKVTGVKATDFISERICKPLNMSDTTVTPTPDMAKRAVIFDEGDIEKTQAIIDGKHTDDGIWDVLRGTAWGMYSTTSDLLKFGIMLQQGGRLGETRVLGKMAVESLSTQRLFGVPDYCWGANTAERRYGLGVDMRHFTGSLTSPGTYFHEGSGHCVLIIDPAEEMVCTCVYPWVNSEWNEECNNRLYNVMWSGLI